MGHAVLQRLSAARVRVVALDAVSAVDPIEDVTELQVDVRDSQAMLEAVRAHHVTDIVHAGAISHPLMLTSQPATVVGINVDGTQNALEAARVCTVQRLVFISSAAVYGPNPPERVVDESSALNPDSIYGASKAAAEMLVRGYHACFGLKIVILRPVSIYGPRRRTASLASYLVANAIDGRVSRIATAAQPFDLVHVDDVARACIRALDSELAVGHAYTIGSSQPVSAEQIVDIVSRLLPDCQIDLQLAPGGGSGEGRFNVAAAARDLAFRAERDLESGLSELIEVLRTRPDLRAAARHGWEALFSS